MRNVSVLSVLLMGWNMERKSLKIGFDALKQMKIWRLQMEKKLMVLDEKVGGVLRRKMNEVIRHRIK